MKGKKRIRILLADDNPHIRKGLQSLIQNIKNTEVIGEAEDGLTAVKKTKELSPDLVIMDIGMPGLNGIGATHRIHSDSPDVKIIALSMRSARRYILEMFKAGASGYILKDRVFEELAEAIKTVTANQYYIGPKIADEKIKDYINKLKDSESSSDNS